MTRQVQLVRFRTDQEVDFVIVGSGAAGGVMAKELSTRGFSVVVMEQGPYLRPVDFGHDELELGEALWLDSYDACIQAAEQGHGVVLGVLPLERIQIEDGRLVTPFEPVLDYPAGVYLLCRPGEESRKEIVALRDWFLEQFE